MNLIKTNNDLLISAKELYVALGIKRKYANWIKESVERAGLEADKDFITILLQSTGGRPITDYQLKRDSALTIIVMSGGQFAKQLRKEVIELYTLHDDGLAFKKQQIEALMDLSKAMTLVSIQKEVERKHFDIYNDKITWYQHRAEILGYSTKDIIEAMQKVNKQHHSVRASLIQLDSCELIRVGVIDFFIALGKTEKYAINAGDLCKSMAQKSEYGNIIWDDTKENPLKLNESEVIERKELFNNQKQLQ